jgi:hypothetical protein
MRVDYRSQHAQSSTARLDMQMDSVSYLLAEEEQDGKAERQSKTPLGSGAVLDAGDAWTGEILKARRARSPVSP